MIFRWSLLFFCVAVWESHGAGQRELLTLMMPEVGAGGVKHNDYMCRSVQLQPVDTAIVQFEPRANPQVAHHMLLFGCPNKPNTRQSWSCKGSNVCGGAQSPQILFAWALNASGLHLPDEVGLEIGPSHDINYAVLQIHYRHPEAVSPEALMGEHEALVLHLTQEKQPLIAGVYILGSMSAITAGKEATHVDTACLFGGPNPIHPFAFRTHAHSLGQVIAGYVVKNGNEDWELIGSRSPQDAQAFYPATNSDTVNPGDWLAARCVFNTQGKTHDVHMGANSEDEMCNFYIMYYMVNNGRSLVADHCWIQAPDTLHFPELRVPEPVPSDGTETEADHSHSHAEHDGDEGDEGGKSTVDKILATIYDIMGDVKGDGESPTTEATTPPTIATNEHQSEEKEEEEEEDYVCPSSVPPGPPSICPKSKPTLPTNTPTSEATPPGSTQAAVPQSTTTSSPQVTHGREGETDVATESQSPSSSTTSPPISATNATDTQNSTVRVSMTAPTETVSQPGTPFSQQSPDAEPNQDQSKPPSTIPHNSSPSSPPADSDAKMPIYVYGIVAGVVVVTIATALLIIGIQYDRRCRWYLLILCKSSASYKQVSTEMRRTALRGPGKQGFSKLRSSDSDSEIEEFPIFSRV